MTDWFSFLLLSRSYDISKPCTTLGEDLCYPETKAISTYLDQPWVRSKLGAADQIGPFQSCSDKVGMGFALSRDALAPTFFHLTGLLENGVRVLIYVGQLDWICNFIGNRRMVEALEWSGAEAFRKAELRDFYVGDLNEPAGQAKSAGLLTFVQIGGAGHMVPLDKPAESLYVTERWLAGEPIVAKEHWKVGGK
jgi:carboxypeptidase C (cathepsin A)